MVIERRTYAKLNGLLGRFPAVVLLGPRQVGKSSLWFIRADCRFLIPDC
jgi:predicted AAA+ superfamily ATPase